MDHREKREAERRAKEKAFIMEPMEWPHWPALPVKHIDSSVIGHRPDAFGLIYAGELNKVYFTNLFAIADKKPQPKTWTEAFAGVESKTYASIDELLREYMVD